MHVTVTLFSLINLGNIQLLGGYSTQNDEQKKICMLLIIQVLFHTFCIIKVLSVEAGHCIVVFPVYFSGYFMSEGGIPTLHMAIK